MEGPLMSLRYAETTYTGNGVRGERREKKEKGRKEEEKEKV